MRASAHLLPVVGRVGQHGGHVEHQLVVLVGGVKRVSSCRVGWKRAEPHEVRASLQKVIVSNNLLD